MSAEKIFSRQGGFKLVYLTEDRFDEAVRLIKESFIPDECLSKGSKLTEDPVGLDEVALMALKAMKDGVSAAAIEESSGKLAGVALNKIKKKTPPGESFLEKFKDECTKPSSLKYTDAMIIGNHRVDMFTKYGVDTILELLFLGVSRDFRKRGVGKMLAETTLEITRCLGIPLCNAVFTSEFSQKIGRAVGMTQVAEVSYEELSYEGEVFSKRTEPHKSCITMVKCM